jgi:energy-converting hydrogenase B subunit D
VIVVVQAVVMLLVAVLGLITVLVKDPLRQLMPYSLFGGALAVLFLVLQAPDVALSGIVVTAIAYPAMILLALAKARNRER